MKAIGKGKQIMENRTNKTIVRCGKNSGFKKLIKNVFGYKAISLGSVSS